MGSRPIRLVSYNVRYFGHALKGLASSVGPKRRIAGALAALEPLPDVICLQEVETQSLRSTLAHRKSHEKETQLEAFMARLEEVFDAQKRAFPYEAYYFRAHTYAVGHVPIYTTGLAVIVNLATMKVESHNSLSPQHITHHFTAALKDRKQSRICAHIRLMDNDGHPFHVFNTHLSLPTPFAKAFWTEKDKMGFGANQIEEAKALSSFIRGHAKGEPFVVCGDFNSAPGSPVFRYLTEEAQFSCAQACLGQCDPKIPRRFPTAGFLNLRMHLDHLFAGGNVEWLDLQNTAPFGDPKSAFHGLSDHVPLIARFCLSD